MMYLARRLSAALFVLSGAPVLLLAGPAYSDNPPKRVYIVQSYEAGHVCGEPQAEGELRSLALGG